jgi:hypothetical protein
MSGYYSRISNRIQQSTGLMTRVWVKQRKLGL